MKEFFLTLYMAVLGWFGVATPVEPPTLVAPVVEVTEVKPPLFPVATFSNDRIVQGEPLALRVCPPDAEVFITKVSEIKITGKLVPFGLVGDCITAFYGADIKVALGVIKGEVTLADGTTLLATATIAARPRVEAPLSIPEKLGGNTPAAATKVVNTLALENKKLAALLRPRNVPVMWSESFMRPIETALVTDAYGYVRDTVGQEITHKGTDYRASVGVAVFAPQDGIVVESSDYTIYGKTIVIDHGFGVQSMLMHLSERLVEPGQRVIRGQLVGKAGSTGYAESPHLHLSIRIGGISIDPEKFYALFGISAASLAS